jgi:diguanylate cyclase
MVDLDDFKEVNDEVGHVEADAMLVQLTTGWRTRLGPAHLIARYGGDEFVFVLRATRLAAAHELIDDLRTASNLAWSVGLTTVEPGEDLETVHGRADRELYRDKAARRERRRAS